MLGVISLRKASWDSWDFENSCNKERKEDELLNKENALKLKV